MLPRVKLLASIAASKGAKDIGEKLGEVAIDGLLDNGVLRDIPILGSAIAMWKAGHEMAAYVFAKKIAMFLAEVESLSRSEREAYISGLEIEKADNDIGESLVLILDGIDSYESARMLGRAFKLLVRGDIHRQTYDIYVHAIRGLNPYLVRQLVQFYENEYMATIDQPAAIYLSNYGLANVVVSTTVNVSTKNMNVSTERTEFGRAFYLAVVKS